MARNYYRYLTAFTCQASSVISANAFSAGTKTAFDSTVSGNVDGCDEAEIEIDVTAYTADARCEVYMEALQHDGVGNNAPKLMGSVAITAVDKYVVRIDGLSEKGNIIIKALTTGFTASASMRGIYASDA